MKITLTVFAFLLFSVLSSAKTSYESYPAAPKRGGVFIDTLNSNPATFVSMLASDVESQEMASMVYLPLFTKDGETYKDIPMLAASVKSSKDNKDHEFVLSEKAKWSDGTKVTSDDVEFSFQKLMDKKTEAAALRGYYEGVSFTKIDALRFKFHVDEPRFNTKDFILGFQPVQKAQFEKESNFNKTKEQLKPIGNSAYKLKSFTRDQTIVFERDPNWWGYSLPQSKPKYNFDTITYKIIPDTTLRYEKWLKLEIDGTLLTSDQWSTQVNGVDRSKIGKSKADGKPVWADKLYFSMPAGWSGIALNLKHPLLQSLKTRQGLAYAMDYDTLYSKAWLGTMEPCLTPFGTRSDNLAPELKNKNNQYRFDPKKAMELFTDDGWKREAGAAVLSKLINGKLTPFKLSFKFYGSSPAQVRTAQILKEGFKKLGIDLDLRPMDGTAFYADWEKSDFEMAFMAWGAGSLHPDPKQLWATESSTGSGSNRVFYSNAEVDALIKKANAEFDMKKRSKIMQKIGKQLYQDLPYLFFGERPFVLQGLNSKLSSPKWIEKYSTGIARELYY